MKFIYIKNDSSSKENGKYQSVAKICKCVSYCMETVWATTTIPIVSRKRIIHKDKSLYQDNYKNLLKNQSHKSNTDSKEYIMKDACSMKENFLNVAIYIFLP